MGQRPAYIYKMAGRVKEHMPKDMIEQIKISQVDIEQTLRAMIDVLVDDIMDTGEGQLQGVVVLRVYEYDGRMYCNPNTGKYERTAHGLRVIASIASNVRNTVHGDDNDYVINPSTSTVEMAGRVRERINCILPKYAVEQIMIEFANTFIDDIMDNGIARIPGILTLRVYKAHKRYLNNRTHQMESYKSPYRLAISISPKLTAKVNSTG